MHKFVVRESAFFRKWPNDGNLRLSQVPRHFIGIFNILNRMLPAASLTRLEEPYPARVRRGFPADFFIYTKGWDRDKI